MCRTQPGEQAQRPLSSSSCFTILHCQNKLLRSEFTQPNTRSVACVVPLPRSYSHAAFAVMAIVMELGRDEITAAQTDGGQREMGPHRARSPPFSARGNEETAAERRGNIWRLNYNLGIISQCIARSVSLDSSHDCFNTAASEGWATCHVTNRGI